jgi:hypothetical protein
MRSLFTTAMAALVLLTTHCIAQNLNQIFPKGELGPAENFTGKAWATGLVADDAVYNTVVGNVYFEPGARSN